MAQNGDKDGFIFLGMAAQPSYMTLKFGNRHGLITGATGTGKTVTLQVLAEGFANAGVPVFAADIKGDLSGIAAMGEDKPFIADRVKQMDLAWQPDQFTTVFWDLFGEQGHPIRATIVEMGPLLLSRLLDLSEAQEGVINILFRYCDENGLALLDLKDLRAMLAEFGTNKELVKELQATYGNMSVSSIGAVQRQLLILENQGAAAFFGEPALELKDFMRKDKDGRGIINLLAADKLMANPRLYATFLLWLLSELFEQLPEVGDLDQPKLVFFFDEAHLLFDDAPKAVLDAVEKVVRLIRSKGVGVYFITQNPLDVPESVLAQLGNRVQHALRAFTPRDQKAVKAAADTFRANPKLDTAKVISEMGKGEALVSMLEGNGTPSMVDRTMIRPPTARIGPVSPEERQKIISSSPLRSKYTDVIDSESAFEKLQQRRQGGAAPAGQGQEVNPQQGGASEASSGGILGELGGLVGSVFGGGGGAQQPAPKGGRTRMTTSEVIVRNVAGSVARSVGTQIGRALIRGVLGSLTK